MKKFEYKMVQGSVQIVPEKEEELLNDLGREGWEVFHVVIMKRRGDPLGTKGTVYWLKRKLNG